MSDTLSRGVWVGLVLALGGTALGMLLTLVGAP